MSKSTFEIDAESLLAVLDRLSGVALENFNTQAVQSVAYQLKENTKEKFLRKLPAADGSKRTKESKYSDVLLDAVRQASTRQSASLSDTTVGRTFVHVLGTRDSGSGTFRARFFEGGTKRDGKQRIQPLNFFGETLSAFSPDRTRLTKQLAKYIERIVHGT